MLINRFSRLSFSESSNYSIHITLKSITIIAKNTKIISNYWRMDIKRISAWQLFLPLIYCLNNNYSWTELITNLSPKLIITWRKHVQRQLHTTCGQWAAVCTMTFTATWTEVRQNRLFDFQTNSTFWNIFL